MISTFWSFMLYLNIFSSSPISIKVEAEFLSAP